MMSCGRTTLMRTRITSTTTSKASWDYIQSRKAENFLNVVILYKFSTSKPRLLPPPLLKQVENILYPKKIDNFLNFVLGVVVEVVLVLMCWVYKNIINLKNWDYFSTFFRKKNHQNHLHSQNRLRIFSIQKTDNFLYYLFFKFYQIKTTTT